MELEVEAAEAMAGLAERLRGVQPERLADCAIEDALLGDADALKERLAAAFGRMTAAVYAISMPEADPRDVHRAMTRARDEKRDDRSYSRIHALGEAPGPTLYVGSSRDLVKRLREHMGHGSRATYALHMGWWALDLGPVTIEARGYDAGIDNAVLCAIEDHAAAQLRPLFGRRGSV